MGRSAPRLAPRHTSVAPPASVAFNMHATTRMLRPTLWVCATHARVGSSVRRGAVPLAARPSHPKSSRRSFTCNAASLTSEDDTTLEAEAERPTRIAQQVRPVGIPLTCTGETGVLWTRHETQQSPLVRWLTSPPPPPRVSSHVSHQY